MSKAHADDAVWKALADPTRREILDALALRAWTTGELVARFDGLCRTAVMKHLDVLEAAGLLLARREGRVRWNHINPVPIQGIHERWVARHVRGRAAAMLRLKEHAENTAASAATEPVTPPRRRTKKASKR